MTKVIIKPADGTGAVESYCDAAKKFETTNTGATVTGDVTISDKIIHAGDTDTVVRFPANNTVTIETAGSERARIDSNGYFGINQTSPGSWLHVSNGELASNADPASAAAPNTTYDGLVVDGSSASIVNIRSRGDGSSSYGRIGFSDDVRCRGFIDYKHDDSGGDDAMTFSTAGSERLRIKSDGDVDVKTGDLIIGTAGKGISFINAADVATGETVSSSVLDDYEEGTFTPIYGGGSNPTVTYDAQYGQYTKIGQLVTLHIRLRTDAVSGGSGNLYIKGFPFTSSSTHGMYGGYITYTGNWKANEAPTLVHVGTSATQCTLYNREDGNEDASAMVVGDLDTSTNDNDVRITIIYPV